MILFLLAMLLCGEAFGEARIDGSTQDSFNSTLAQMLGELPPQKADELKAAINLLPFAGMKSVRDTPADGIVKLDTKKIDGMTADQIIELARKTVSVKITFGPPPGLPERFKAPLRPTPNQTGVPTQASPLVGTVWDMTDDINGNISHTHYTLRADGEVDVAQMPHSHWEQAGNAVRISFNDSYVVYLGTVDQANSMRGAAANINGTEWTWVARRESGNAR
jgi:hypothetical protein